MQQANDFELMDYPTTPVFESLTHRLWGGNSHVLAAKVPKELADHVSAHAAGVELQVSALLRSHLVFAYLNQFMAAVDERLDELASEDPADSELGKFLDECYVAVAELEVVLDQLAERRKEVSKLRKSLDSKRVRIKLFVAQKILAGVRKGGNAE